MEFKEVIQERYATKKFDGTELEESKVKELLEMIKLSASSFGLQPFKVLVIKDREVKEKLSKASWDQPQITTCSHLLVFCSDKDVKSRITEYEQMMKDAGIPEDKVSTYIGMMRGFEEGLSEDHKLTWAQRQTYIAVGNAINGAKDLGFDSCPMEGFSAEEYSKTLELDENLVPTCLVPIGIAADEAHPKIRFKDEELFQYYP
tara:strand:+ start:29584 stop:30192 length:609 start_codon:yes stop_codon:yes gene_type:complete